MALKKSAKKAKLGGDMVGMSVIYFGADGNQQKTIKISHPGSSYRQSLDREYYSCEVHKRNVEKILSEVFGASSFSIKRILSSLVLGLDQMLAAVMDSKIKHMESLQETRRYVEQKVCSSDTIDFASLLPFFKCIGLNERRLQLTLALMMYGQWQLAERGEIEKARGLYNKHWHENLYYQRERGIYEVNADGRLYKVVNNKRVIEKAYYVNYGEESLFQQVNSQLVAGYLNEQGKFICFSGPNMFKAYCGRHGEQRVRYSLIDGSNDKSLYEFDAARQQIYKWNINSKQEPYQDGHYQVVVEDNGLFSFYKQINLNFS